MTKEKAKNWFRGSLLILIAALALLFVFTVGVAGNIKRSCEENCTNKVPTKKWVEYCELNCSNEEADK